MILTDLSDTDPESGFLDIGGGFVISTEEAYRRGGSRAFRGVAHSRGNGESVEGVGDIGWVGGRPNNNEVVTEGVVAR